MELFFYIFLLLLVYGFYKSVYFDIPRGIVLAKHAKGASEFIELDDGSLVHVRDEGILEKDVIVLIHGFNGSLFNFEPMVSYLKDNFRILSLDLPAHGLTGAIKSNFYSYEGFEKLITDILKVKSIEKFYLVGHSMGGVISWKYALNNLERISGLIIIGSPFIGSENEYKKFQSENAPPIAFKLLETKIMRFMLKYFTPRFLVKEGVSKTVYNKDLVTEKLVDQFHDIILLEGSREAMGMVILSIEDDFIADPKLLQNLKIPTLILHGEKDKLVDISFTNHFLEQIPNVKLISYPKVGHMPPMEIPEKLAYDIKSFIGT